MGELAGLFCHHLLVTQQASSLFLFLGLFSSAARHLGRYGSLCQYDRCNFLRVEFHFSLSNLISEDPNSVFLRTLTLSCCTLQRNLGGAVDRAAQELDFISSFFQVLLKQISDFLKHTCTLVVLGSWVGQDMSFLNGYRGTSIIFNREHCVPQDVLM